MNVGGSEDGDFYDRCKLRFLSSDETLKVSSLKVSDYLLTLIKVRVTPVLSISISMSWVFY